MINRGVAERVRLAGIERKDTRRRTGHRDIDLNCAEISQRVVFAKVLGQRKHSHDVAARGAEPEQRAVNVEQRVGLEIRPRFRLASGRRRGNGGDDFVRPVARFAAGFGADTVVVVAGRARRGSCGSFRSAS